MHLTWHQDQPEIVERKAHRGRSLEWNNSFKECGNSSPLKVHGLIAKEEHEGTQGLRFAWSHATQGMAHRSGLKDWLRILMGPRPPSVRWPRAQQNRRNQSGPKQGREHEARVQSLQEGLGPEAVPKVRVSPAEAAVKASARVAKFSRIQTKQMVQK